MSKLLSSKASDAISLTIADFGPIPYPLSEVGFKKPSSFKHSQLWPFTTLDLALRLHKQHSSQHILGSIALNALISGDTGCYPAASINAAIATAYS